MRKCKLCKSEEAVYAMQWIDNKKPSFHPLGEHVPGFSVIPVGHVCAAKESDKASLAYEASLSNERQPD